MPTAAAIVGGIGLIGSVVSGVSQAGATTDAANIQAGAAQAGQDALQGRFEDTRDLLSPFIEGSSGAFQEQQALSGALGAEAEAEAIRRITEGEQFQFLQGQGERSLGSAASARGQLGSGSRLKALSRFRSDLLSQQIGNRFNRLGAVTGTGLGAASALAGAGTRAGEGQANLIGQAGAANAAGTIGRAQAFQSGLSGAIQGVGQIIGGFSEPQIQRGLA